MKWLENEGIVANPGIHTAEKVEARRGFWQKRGLMIFYLPPYSPLNLAETLWRKLKYEWLQASEYLTRDRLFNKVRQALAAVGKGLKIQFSEFRLGST